MKKGSIGIIAMIIFSAIMLVVIWFIFTTGMNFFLEYAIPSQNAASFATMTRKIGEGWRKGSAWQNFNMPPINPKDTFAIGIVTDDSAVYVADMTICRNPQQLFCVKMASKEKIAKCNSPNDLCICLFRLKYLGNFQTPGVLNDFYSAGISVDYDSDFDNIKTWNNEHFPQTINKLERLDVILCESIYSDLKCGNVSGTTTQPCILVSDTDEIIVWMQAPISISTILFDRNYDGEEPLHNLIIKTYPSIEYNPPEMKVFCSYPGCTY